MNRIIFFLVIAILCSCTNGAADTEYQDPTTVNTDKKNSKNVENLSYTIESQKDKKEYSARMIFTDSLGWGYQIFDGSTMLINQTHIPSIQGNKGFKSREAAQITANFVLYKLSNGLFPPTLDKKELDSLGVL